MAVKIQKLPLNPPVPFDINIPTPIDDGTGNLSWNVSIQGCATQFSTFKVDSLSHKLVPPPWLGPMGGWQVTNEMKQIPPNLTFLQVDQTISPDPNNNGTPFPFSSGSGNGKINFTIVDQGGSNYTITCLISTK